MKFDNIDSIISEQDAKHATNVLNCVIISLGKRNQDDAKISGNIKLLLAILSYKHDLVATGHGIEIKDNTIRWSNEILSSNNIENVRIEFDKLSDQLLTIVDDQLLNDCSDKTKMLETICSKETDAIKQCVSSNFSGINKLSVIEQFFTSCILADNMAKALDSKSNEFKVLENAMITVDYVISLFAIRTYFGLTRLVNLGTDGSDGLEKYLYGIEDITKGFEM
jgi:hypothetical protein